MEWFFALTMFGIGVVLKTEDFRQIAAKPTLVLIGTCAQFTIMPFGAYAVAKLYNLPQALAVGLILTGAAPDAMSGNVICYIARADVAYAVSLTTVSTLLCPIFDAWINIYFGTVTAGGSFLEYGAAGYPDSNSAALYRLRRKVLL